MNHVVPIIKTVWIVAREILLSVFVIGLMSVLAFLGAVYYVFSYATPGVEDLGIRELPQTTVIYDSTGSRVLYEIHGEENRKVLSHDEIPDVMRTMTIVAEDDAFYEHHGIDYKAIARALLKNIQQQEIEQGGSTITQQLARNVYLTREKTVKRKFYEAILALKIEQRYSKEEILDFYLNQVPYGSNAYGVQAAVETYFGKDAKDLHLDEAAFLSALPKATTYYSPYGSNTELLVKRQKNILDRSSELGLVSRGRVEESLGQDTLSRVKPFSQDITAPHFVFYVIEELEKLYGPEALETGGMHVYTTIDLSMQSLAEQVVSDGVANNVRYNAENAALVAMEPNSGAVRAMVGSNDYFEADNLDGQVNVALRPRQPGSAFKPIAYAAAFERGYQPETLLWDVPTDFGADGSGRNYTPGNYDGQFRGRVSMRDALAMSLNIPAVKTLYLAGVHYTIDLAQSMGITTLTERDRYGLALVLGGAEITLLDGASAFGVFANDGERVPAHGISHIIVDGEEVFRFSEKPRVVLDPQIARKVNSVLSDNGARAGSFGTNSPLSLGIIPAAAKTGTTQDYRDGWTIGYIPNLSVGVWAGNNDNRPMRFGAAGVYVAAPMWNAFMKEATKRYSYIGFDDYKRIKSDKPFIAGRVPDGIEKAERKEEKRRKKGKDPKGEYFGHSILHYVNREDPLGNNIPNFGDPMLKRWEEPLVGT